MEQTVFVRWEHLLGIYIRMLFLKQFCYGTLLELIAKTLPHVSFYQIIVNPQQLHSHGCSETQMASVQCAIVAGSVEETE